MIENLPATFCKWPFFNLMINARGEYLPCCKYNGQLKDNGQVMNASTHTVDKAFQGTELVELRKKFLAGAKPSACQQCWDEEAAGIRSMRYDGDIFDVPMSQIEHPDRPTRMDIYPSNVCNLRCRICNPGFSTSWMEEGRQTMNWFEGTHINLTQENLAIIESWLPNLQELGFFGGEPLYQKETKLLLKKCVETGHSKHISVLINTNTTIYAPEFVEYLTQFRKVYLNFSVDDVGPRFEYLRKNANWEQANDHIGKFVAGGGVTDGDVLQCKICCTVSSLNVYYLPGVLEWAQRTFPGICVYLNFLHRPPHFCIRNLPASVKDAVAERLRAYRPEGMEFDKMRTRTMDDVLELLYQPIEDGAFAQFYREVQRGDNFRGETFADVFPEYFALMKPFIEEAESSLSVTLPLIHHIEVQDASHELAVVEDTPISSEAQTPEVEETTPSPPQIAHPIKLVSPSEVPTRVTEVFGKATSFNAEEESRRHESAMRELRSWSEGSIAKIVADRSDRIETLEGDDIGLLGSANDVVGRPSEEVLSSLIRRFGQIAEASDLDVTHDRTDRELTFARESEPTLKLRVIEFPRFSPEGRLIGCTTFVAGKRIASREGSLVGS